MSTRQQLTWFRAAQPQSLRSASHWMMLFAAVLLVLAALWPAATPERTALLAPVSASDPVIAVSSDVQILSSLSTASAVATSNLALAMSPDAAWLAGDEADDATTAEYNTYPSHWGRLYDVLDVVPGNHDAYGYANYASYFGTHGTPYQRAETVGAWRVYFLDSNAPLGESSATYTWLQSDLAAHPNQPIAAVWHHPLWSTDSVYGGDDTRSAALWSLLYEAHADLVINGHSHGYQRWAKLSPDGVEDPNGLREFIVATGGRTGYSWERTDSRVEYRQNDNLGVMRLVLHPTSYEWQFQSTSGAIMDQGSDSTNNTASDTPAPTAPTAPTGLRATRGNASASLNWTLGADGGSAITGYTLQVLRGATVVRTQTTGTARPFNITGLTNGTAYNFRLQARNTVGTSPLSAASNTVTPATVPGRTRILAPARGAVGRALTAIANWNAPMANGGSAITSYRVKALRMAANGITVVGTPVYVTVAGTARTRSMTLPAGNYRFAVRAINAVGTGAPSARSALVAPR